MARGARAIRDALRWIDVLIEVVDARIARSGRYPLRDDPAGGPRRFIALTRDDLADPAVTRQWLHRHGDAGVESMALDARVARSVGRLARRISSDTPVRKGVARAMIVGVPNSGKSSIVNSLLGRAKAKTEDRAGVTRQMQWFRLAPTIEVLDTPGVLPPKIATAEARWKLAICGALPSNRFDPRDVAEAFHRWVFARVPESPIPNLSQFAAQRGFLRKGGESDLTNAARAYIRVFNEGGFGRISLEHPDDAEAA